MAGQTMSVKFYSMEKLKAKQSRAKQIIEEVEGTKSQKGAKQKNENETNKMADKNNNELCSRSLTMHSKREPGMCHHWLMTAPMMIIVHVSHPFQCHFHFVVVIVLVVD